MSKPKFDPSKPFSVANTKPKFDPSKPFEPVSEPDISELDSAARGAAQGLTFGLADEAVGAFSSPVGALKEIANKFGADFSDEDIEEYKKQRDESRKNFDDARKANPYSYGAGEIGGGIATAFIPGVGAIGAAGKAATLGGKVAAGAAAAAKAGAVAGLGMSEEESLSGLAKDTAIGAGTGAVVGGAIPVVSAGVKATGKVVKDVVPWLAKKGASVVTQLPEEAIERYTTRNTQVKNARNLEDVARDVTESVGELSKKEGELSGKAFNNLKDANLLIPKDNIVKNLQTRIDTLKANGIFSQEAAQEIKTMQSFVDNISAFPGDDLDGPTVKRLVQQIDESLGVLKKKAGDKTTSAQREMIGTRSDVDRNLKELSPEYASTMDEVAGFTKQRQSLNQSFGTPETAYNNLKSIARDSSPFKKELLRSMDSSLDKGLVDEALDSGVKKAFEGRSTNGSRNVNLGNQLSGTFGSILGWVSDSFARPAVGKTIDIGTKIVSSLQPYKNQLGKYASVLENAAIKGPGPFLMTHNLLLKNDPKYNEVINDLD